MTGGRAGSTAPGRRAPGRSGDGSCGSPSPAGRPGRTMASGWAPEPQPRLPAPRAAVPPGAVLTAQAGRVPSAVIALLRGGGGADAGAMTAQQQSPDEAGRATRAAGLVPEASGVREHLTATIVAEFAVAVAWVMAYARGGRTWDGLTRLAARYHWPQATAFRDLVAPGLTAHATAIAVACPFVLAFLAFSWRQRWPVGGFALFWCGSAYSCLTLGAWLSAAILVPLIIVLYYLSERGPVDSSTFMTYLLAGVVMGLAVTGISIWLLPGGTKAGAASLTGRTAGHSRGSGRERTRRRLTKFAARLVRPRQRRCHQRSAAPGD